MSSLISDEERDLSPEFVQSQIDYYSKHLVCANSRDSQYCHGLLNRYRTIQNIQEARAAERD